MNVFNFDAEPVESTVFDIKPCFSPDQQVYIQFTLKGTFSVVHEELHIFCSLRSKRKGDGVRGEPAKDEASRSESASEESREGNGEEGRDWLPLHPIPFALATQATFSVYRR